MDWCFLVSVTCLSFALFFWIGLGSGAQTLVAVVGFALLATITALALLEHWLLILNLPDAKLWRWMLPKGRSAKTTNTKGALK